jgi:penicillin-binding protein 1C
MLEEFGVERFQQLLKKMGMTTLDKPSGHYGLSLILGGGEAKLWELGGIYASMARILGHYNENHGKYFSNDIYPPVYSIADLTPDPDQEKTSSTPAALGAGAIYLTFKALLEVNRPDQEAEWKSFGSSRKIAWKTGTSFGFRDAWAIGTTPEYVVAVWAGNADGEGRPGLTGITAAAPLMFDIFDALPPSTWFSPPWGDLVQIPVCTLSGYRSTADCEAVDTTWVPLKGVKAAPCPYHRIIHLDASGKFRVNSDCEEVSKMQHLKWFILPPAMEWYYKPGNPAYRLLPPLNPGCNEEMSLRPMEFIFPRDVSKILVPLELDGKPGRIVFEAAHRNPSARIHWYLDNSFLGTTTVPHQMTLNPDVGKHYITLVDSDGNRLVKSLEVVGR